LAFQEDVVRFSRSVVTVSAVIALAACQGHEAITRDRGDRGGVVGVVTMAAGMTNSSPAGVRVAVGGTSMSAVLGTDGRFLFMAVPNNAELIFTRADINAKMAVSPSRKPMTIELSADEARKVVVVQIEASRARGRH
jgi:hypothetical protein